MEAWVVRDKESQGYVQAINENALGELTGALMFTDKADADKLVSVGTNPDAEEVVRVTVEVSG